MLIDTHAHLYLQQFKHDIDDVVNRAKLLKISGIFLPNIDRNSINDLHRLCDAYPDLCHPLMGLHPCSVNSDYRDELAFIKSVLSRRSYFGIGETGIDLYWDQTYKKEQIDAFEQQIEWAKEYDVPIIIHSRDSLDLTIELIRTHQDGSLKGIFHCFNGTVDQCREVSDLNFLMGLGGVITYKNAGLDEMVRYMPYENMVLETDAPYLSPVPYRGKRNESSYIAFVAEKVSQLRKDDVEVVMEKTTLNAQNIYQIKM